MSLKIKIYTNNECYKIKKPIPQRFKDNNYQKDFDNWIIEESESFKNILNNHFEKVDNFNKIEDKDIIITIKK
jgi:hypothetical protein